MQLWCHGLHPYSLLLKTVQWTGTGKPACANEELSVWTPDEMLRHKLCPIRGTWVKYPVGRRDTDDLSEMWTLVQRTQGGRKTGLWCQPGHSHQV